MAVFAEQDVSLRFTSVMGPTFSEFKICLEAYISN